MTRLLLIVLLGALVSVECCNEAVCGSIVTKCLLTKSCSCEIQTQTCSKECFNCLGHLYIECCSCVDMCPKNNETISMLSKKSHVEDFSESVPMLFDALTEEADELGRWDVTVFKVDIDVNQYTKKQFKLHKKTAKEVISIKHKIVTVNCTVVFWASCMSWNKCKSNCMSMGATSYRWFHNGCCECIGQYCIDYGINESRCRLCSVVRKPIEDMDETELDYGQYDSLDYEDNET